MSNKTVSQLDSIGNFTEDDFLLVFDNETNTSRKASIDTVATISGTKGGFTFTSGFDKRVAGDNTEPIRVTSDQVNKWVPLDLNANTQSVLDEPWWPGAAPSNGIDLFGGSALPHGVSRMLDFTQTWSTDSYSDVSDLLGDSRTGTLRFDELDTGTTNLLRFDMNITPQIANTTVEVGLWFQPRSSLDGLIEGAFPLPGNPLFFGTGTVGNTYLSRPTTTMYIASDADRFAYALPVIKSDNPIIIEPLSMLAQNLR